MPAAIRFDRVPAWMGASLCGNSDRDQYLVSRLRGDSNESRRGIRHHATDRGGGLPVHDVSVYCGDVVARRRRLAGNVLFA